MGHWGLRCNSCRSRSPRVPPLFHICDYCCLFPVTHVSDPHIPWTNHMQDLLLKLDIGQRNRLTLSIRNYLVPVEVSILFQMLVVPWGCECRVSGEAVTWAERVGSLGSESTLWSRLQSLTGTPFSIHPVRVGFGLSNLCKKWFFLWSYDIELVMLSKFFYGS